MFKGIIVTLIIMVYITLCSGITALFNEYITHDMYQITTTEEDLNKNNVVGTSKYPMFLLESEETGWVMYANEAYQNTNQPIMAYDIEIKSIDENTSISKVYSQMYFVGEIYEVEAMIATAEARGIVLFSNEVHIPTYFSTLFIILICVFITFKIVSIFNFEGNKNRNLLLKMGGISREEFKKVNYIVDSTQLLVILCIPVIVMIVCSRQFVVAIAALILSILILKIIFSLDLRSKVRQFNKLNISNLIKGERIYKITSKISSFSIIFNKVVISILIIITCIVGFYLFSQLKTVTLWSEISDYYYMNATYGFAYQTTEDAETSSDMNTEGKYRINAIHQLEETNNAIYSYDTWQWINESVRLIMLNHNMLQTQVEEANKLDESKNYLIVPTQINVDDATNLVNEYFTALSNDDRYVGNTLEYEVIHMDIDPIYSYNIEEGYYQDDSIYYVVGSENDSYVNGTYAYQELLIENPSTSDLQGVYFEDISSMEFSNATNQARSIMSIIFRFFLLTIAFIVLALLVYFSSMQKVVMIDIKANYKKYALMRLDGRSAKELNKRRYKKLSITNSILIIPIFISCVVLTIIFAFFGAPYLGITIFGIMVIIYYVIDPIVLNKVIKKADKATILSIVKGKYE